MSLIRTSFYTSIATGIRILCGLAANKVIAVFVGPVGLALYGQFMNLFNMSTTVASGGIGRGVTKYIAEHNGKEDVQGLIIQSSLLITGVMSIVISGLLVLFSESISGYLFRSYAYSSVIIILGVSITFISLNGLFYSILNGLKEISLFIRLNVLFNIVSLIYLYVLTAGWNLKGAFLAIIAAQITLSFVNAAYFIRRFRTRYIIRSIAPSAIYLKRLLMFSAMSVTSGLLVPATQIYIRDSIIHLVSLDAAGYWQAVWKTSEVYLSFIVMSLNVYYLPRISEINEHTALSREVVRAFRSVIPVVLVIALIIFATKQYIILILFSSEFNDMANLFQFQLIGDIFKISSWLISYILVAKALIAIYILFEIVFVILFMLFSRLFLFHYGLIGVTYSYALCYFAYFISLLIFYSRLKKQLASNYIA